MFPERFMGEERVSGPPRPAPTATDAAPPKPRFIDTADPSWYARVLRTLARDYPEISDKVWHTAVAENADEWTERRARERDAAGS